MPTVEDFSSFLADEKRWRQMAQEMALLSPPPDLPEIVDFTASPMAPVEDRSVQAETPIGGQTFADKLAKGLGGMAGLAGEPLAEEEEQIRVPGGSANAGQRIDVQPQAQVPVLRAERTQDQKLATLLQLLTSGAI